METRDLKTLLKEDPTLAKQLKVDHNKTVLTLTVCKHWERRIRKESASNRLENTLLHDNARSLYRCSHLEHLDRLGLESSVASYLFTRCCVFKLLPISIDAAQLEWITLLKCGSNQVTDRKILCDQGVSLLSARIQFLTKRKWKKKVIDSNGNYFN